MIDNWAGQCKGAGINMKGSGCKASMTPAPNSNNGPAPALVLDILYLVCRETRNGGASSQIRHRLFIDFSQTGNYFTPGVAVFVFNMCCKTFIILYHIILLYHRTLLTIHILLNSIKYDFCYPSDM